jgi:quercetin dioxygenase-like cupin family protein
MRLPYLMSSAAICLFSVTIASAQDAVKVDPKHYIETENAQVRVVRVHYGPHEKSVMHSHPALVAVYLSDGSVRMHKPDGTVQEAQAKNGQAVYMPPEVHNPENIADTPLDLILVELKGGETAAATKSSGK